MGDEDRGSRAPGGAWGRSLVAFVVALAVGLALVRLEERQRTATQRGAALAAAQESARALETALARVSAAVDVAAPGSGPRLLARLDIASRLWLVDAVGQPRPFPEAPAAEEDRALFEQGTAGCERVEETSGPFASPRGAFLLLLLFDGKDACRLRGGAAVPVSRLLAAGALESLKARGWDYALSRGASLVVRSTEIPLDAPVDVALRPGGDTWSLSLSPRAGWVSSADRRGKVGLVLLVSAVFALLARDLVRRPERLEAEIARRTARVVEANRQTMAEVLERQKAESRLLFEASHDRLTGIHNRDYLISRLSRLLVESGRPTALLLVGIGRFRALTGGFGAATGDRLLVGTARRLSTFVRVDDVAARTSDDEFGLLLPGVADTETATAIVGRLRESLEAPFHVDGHDLRLSVSIGVVLADPTGPGAEERLRDAQLALQKASAEAGSKLAFFSSDLAHDAEHVLQLEEDLSLAIRRSELRVAYQPIISMQTGRLTGFEALVRWKHPVRGQIPPGQFIPVAEATGLVIALDRWVWRRAATTLRRLHVLFPDESPTVSVNLSTRQLREPDLVDDVADVLATSGLPAKSFRLEITESMMLENAAAAAVLGRLKKLDVKLLLDDFGTGYSSLSYLHELPIDILKIDRSFVSRLGTESKHEEIVKTILALSRGLGLSVVAEGIETAGQRDQLKSMGCGFGQGYYFSKPIEEDQLEPLLASRRTW